MSNAVQTTNTRSLKVLFFTQFISAFADNMILFFSLALIKVKLLPDTYIGVIQAAFLLAFVVLAPFVGAFADKHAKSTVLLVGNAVKAVGILCFVFGIDPAVSYAIVGAGAAIYSPAKYGILPSLTQNENELLKANAKIEGYTIFAILTGSVCGGILVGISLPGTMFACLLLYVISLLFSLFIPRIGGNKEIRYLKDSLLFFNQLGLLFQNRTTRFSLVGTGSFWMSSAVIRLAVIAWIPIHLGIHSLDQISMLVAVTGIGIMFGALATPALVPAKQYYNSYVYGIIMVAVILILPMISNLIMTIALLLLIGFAGGVFIVPMNSVLQDVGHRMVGSGKTIAVQNLIENGLMLTGVGVYTQFSQKGVRVESSIYGIGLILAVFIVYLVLQKGTLKKAVVK
jgi:LPLT family lysophospholipid transporter-like MFS transporter